MKEDKPEKTQHTWSKAAVEIFHTFSQILETNAFAGTILSIVACITFILHNAIDGKTLIELVKLILDRNIITVIAYVSGYAICPIITLFCLADRQQYKSKIESLGARIREKEEMLIENRPTTEPHKKESNNE